MKGSRKRGDPYHPKDSRQSSLGRTEDQPPMTNLVHLSLIVKNTMLTVVHILKPNSLTRSLQIHCTVLTSLRSHTSWAWPEKCDPTNIL